MGKSCLLCNKQGHITVMFDTDWFGNRMNENMLETKVAQETDITGMWYCPLWHYQQDILSVIVGIATAYFQRYKPK